MSCNEGRILHLLGSTSRSVSNGMMYPPYAPWKRGNLIKYTNQECVIIFFFREVHRGKEWVCRWSYLLGEIMVVWGLYQAFLSGGGGYILSIYREG